MTPLDLRDELSNGRGERAYARAWSSCGAGDKHQLMPEKTQGRCKGKTPDAILQLLWSFWAPLPQPTSSMNLFRLQDSAADPAIAPLSFRRISWRIPPALRASVTASVMTTLNPDIWLSSLSWAPCHVSVHRLGISIHMSHNQVKLNNLN